MMSRAAITRALESSFALNQLGFHGGNIYAANAVDTPIEKPFLVMRWEERVESFANHGVQTLTIWVHDNLGDYTRIDRALDATQQVLTSLVHAPGDDGRIVTYVEWNGDSADLYDDGFETITRNATFRVVSRTQ